jgi:hypothetical protein
MGVGRRRVLEREKERGGVSEGGTGTEEEMIRAKIREIGWR